MASKRTTLPELRRYDYVVQLLLPHLSFASLTVKTGRERFRKPMPGDLVMLQSAPMSEWHLSFYLEEPTPGIHKLESLKTGRIATWENVGFQIVDLKHIERARWTDEQFEFKDKFKRAFRKGDFYMQIPFITGFDGGAVLISVRTRFGFSKTITTLAPFPYHRATQKALLAHLTAGAEEHEQRTANERQSVKDAATTEAPHAGRE